MSSKKKGIIFSDDGKPTKIMKQYEKIYKEGLRQNEISGGNFPMWGTCLGFEAMVYLTSGYKVKVKHPSSQNLRFKLKFQREYYNKSDFKKFLRPEIAKYLEENQVSYFNHHDGFRLNDFYANKPLKETFNVVAYYTANNGKYVAMMQHKKYPIYGVQFHPEKILFEHKRRVNTKLTLQSSMASQQLARVLFAPTLRSMNMFEKQEVLNHFLLENFSSIKTVGMFESIFVFELDYFNEEELNRVPKQKVQALIV